MITVQLFLTKIQIGDGLILYDKLEKPEDWYTGGIRGEQGSGKGGDDEF